ncbi:MAG: phosphoesterase [Gammaproteobacteria bacterium]|nr:phosphoesterase [Gammaproteobacteria bacterium]
MPQAGGQGQQGDDALAPLWITGVMFFIAYVVWATKHELIVQFVFYINLGESYLVNLLWPGDPLQGVINYIHQTDPSKVDWDTLMNVTTMVGAYMRFIFGLILGLLAFILYQKDLSSKFSKVYSMKTLRLQEKENWPAISPVVAEDLVKTDIDVGPWAMALNPMEFARKYNLLKKNDILMDPSAPGQEMTASIKKGDAKRVFTMQLGPLWQGFERCQPHVVALAAIFLARMNRDREGALNLSNNLSKEFATGKMNYAAAWPLLNKFKDLPVVREVVGQHAYVYTVMASLLKQARNDGVVPSSEFLWLKPIDRRLWYMLNCVGRQTPYVEISGAFAHWKAEIKMQRPSLTPMVDEATRALEIAIKEVRLTPKEIEELPS